MSSEVERKLFDPDLLGATTALQRSALRARELAERTGTPSYVMRNGHIVDTVTGKEVKIPRRSEL